MRIERASEFHRAAWTRMRQTLWPDEDSCLLAIQAHQWLADPEAGQHAWLAIGDDDVPVGFAEAALRRDYVNGCDTSPVAFLEGLYVVPEHRRHGIARALVAEVEAWARTRGVSEFASDALLDNTANHAFHRAIGFEETDRVVYFRRALAP